MVLYLPFSLTLCPAHIGSFLNRAFYTHFTRTRENNKSKAKNLQTNIPFRCILVMIGFGPLIFFFWSIVFRLDTLVQHPSPFDCEIRFCETVNFQLKNLSRKIEFSCAETNLSSNLVSLVPKIDLGSFYNFVLVVSKLLTRANYCIRQEENTQQRIGNNSNRAIKWMGFSFFLLL